MTDQTLCVGLRFRFGASSAQWERTLRGLTTWEPSLRPTTLYRRGEPDAAPDEPWSDTRWVELARRCATQRSWSWGLENRTGPGTSLDVGCGQHQGDVLIALDRPPGDLNVWFAALLAACRGGAEPALGLLYDGDAHDQAEFVWQGLHRLDRVPPLLYLDAIAVDALGGGVRFTDLPGGRTEMPGGGFLLEIGDPWQNSAEDRKRAELIARRLGISTSTPLVLS